MKVILLKDVSGVGKQHDIVEVRDGYAKNYLFKTKSAVPQTTFSKDVLNKDLTVEAKAEMVRIMEAVLLKKKIDEINLNFSLKVFNGKTFGSISYKQVIEKLSKNGIIINKYMLDNNGKNIGVGLHILNVNIYKHVTALLHVNIQETS